MTHLDESYKIDYKNLTSTNITTQYASNEARITTLKASKEAYLKMLAKTDITVNEIILIQKEIETIDTELTELEILKNQYDSLLDYSTIRVTITEKESFVNTYLSYLATLFTGIFKILLYLLPFILVAGIVLLCVYIYIKKKDKKEYEVQDGWIGRIFPFDLIQSTILKEQYQSLANKEAKLSEIASTYEEILDSLTEEEKESNVVNDDKDAFVSAEITKEAKKIKAENKGVKFDEDSFEYKVLKVAELIAEEKSLKSKIKQESADLQNNTKETIENLTDEQAIKLLETKWITPLGDELHNLPETIVNDLASKIKSLSEKYAITFAEVENDICKTEKELSTMIDDLTGEESDMKGLAELKKLLGE